MSSSPNPPALPAPSRKRSAPPVASAAKRQNLGPLELLARMAEIEEQNGKWQDAFDKQSWSAMIRPVIDKIAATTMPSAISAPICRLFFVAIATRHESGMQYGKRALPPQVVHQLLRLYGRLQEARLHAKLYGTEADLAFFNATALDKWGKSKPTFPPAARLVGIELNPGPPKRTKAKVVAVVTKKKGAKAKIQTVAGRGDYRPTAFARTRGRGDYISDAGASVGSSLGKFLGEKAGGLLSSVASPFLKLVGMGDYRAEGPKHNSLYERNREAPVSHSGQLSSLVGGNPNPMNMGACSVQFGAKAPRVTHREYIGPVYGGTGFITRTYRIQPGLSGPLSMFPWGSSIAKCFQQYRLCGMILEYKSTSTNYAAGTALGTVMMSTLYDAEATPLATVAEVDNNDFTTSDAPSNSFIHPIECASDKNTVDVRYVRTSNGTSLSTDDRLSDVGVFQLSTNGLTAASNVQIGELWCSYDIEFLKPALVDQHLGTTFQATGSSTIMSGTHNVFPNPVVDPENSLAVTVSANSITLPAGYNGNYLVTYSVSTSTQFSTFQLNSVGSDITPLLLFDSPSGVATSSGGAAGLGSSSLKYAYSMSTIANNTPAANNTINFSNVVLMSSGSIFWTLIITPLDNDITSYTDRARAMLAKMPDEAFLRTYLRCLGSDALRRVHEEAYEDIECESGLRPDSPRPTSASAPPPSSSSSATSSNHGFFRRLQQ